MKMFKQSELRQIIFLVKHVCPISKHSGPYQYPILKRYVDRTFLARKEVEDILGGEESWKNVDQTDGKLNISHSPLRRMWQPQGLF